MGVTIPYRGSLADIERVEDFEDRVLDLALEVGGQARVWRSVADDDPRRIVRGVMLELYPGQETTSLLISPEGWLVQLKRALRGAAFAFGMPFPLRDDGVLGQAEFDELVATLQSLQTDIYAELARLREAREPE